MLRVEAKFKYDDSNPVDTVNASSAVLTNATTDSTRPPPPNSDVASLRSATGKPTATGHDHHTPPRTIAVPPCGLALAAMLSVQLGSALSMGLISSVCPAGTAWLRLSAGALILLALARPPRAAGE